jgi:hypothetical protein
MGLKKMYRLFLNSRKWLKKAWKTEHITKKTDKKLYNYWKNIIETFNENLELFQEEHQQNMEALEGTLIYCQMICFPKRLALVQNLTTWGYYHSALIELRFMLETVILSYYLDKQLPNTNHKSKMKLMQKHKGELWGSRLRRRAYMHEPEFGEEVNDILDAINDSIDDYLAESTIDVWQEENMPFNLEEFKECLHHSQKVSKVIIKHFKTSFPDFIIKGLLEIKEVEEEEGEEEISEIADEEERKDKEEIEDLKEDIEKTKEDIKDIEEEVEDTEVEVEEEVEEEGEEE